MAALPPSNSQVAKAGKVIRRVLDGRGEYTEGDARAAIDVITEFRAAHATPLVKANNGLRSMLKTAGARNGTDYGREVAQRLKRLPTIVDKLIREPEMSLARMQDIGGCRVVLPDEEAVYVMATWPALRKRLVRVNDYIERPKPDGYRGIHMVVEYTDQWRIPRKVEIQLRTQGMHNWAVEVERVGSRIGENIKGGEGPEPIRRFFRLTSDAIAIEERGGAVPAHLEDQIREAREEAVRLL